MKRIDDYTVCRLGMALAGIFLLIVPVQAGEPTSAHANPLKSVRSFMYQLQGMEDPASLEQLAKSPYDLLVIEPTFTMKRWEAFNAKAMVAKLKAGKSGRLVVAYVDIGEAEQFRIYWDKAWKPPTKKTRGSPAFLLATDPDGWKDDVSIAFWDPRWRDIWLGSEGLLKKIMDAGFDGIYMDWVEAYDEEGVVAEARRQGVEPVKAMVGFIAAIRQQVHKIQPQAVVMAQNAPDLIDMDPRYASLLDGVAFEDTWFRGDADAEWDSPKGGDIANDSTDDNSTTARLKQYQKFLKAGIPVFSVDYCLKPTNAARVYETATKAGLIPLVTRVSLGRLTITPPPGIGSR